VNSRNREEEDIIRRTTNIGRPLGFSDFLDKMESLLGRHLRPRKAGRPPKKKEEYGEIWDVSPYFPNISPAGLRHAD
ncbi:MAG: hypothetical protein V1749_00135, partial [Candidatus Desantisbacteria bacterium]